MKKTERYSLLIAGVHQSTDAYPNNLYRIRQLRERLGAREVNFPMWATPTGGLKIARSPWRSLWRGWTSHWRVVLTVACAPDSDCVYIPYPAPLVAWTLTLLPHRSRRMVIDSFISVYDTVVNDRALWPARSLRSRLLFAIERKAFANADRVIVDTQQNANFYARLFNLPAERFLALPLSTNEDDYSPAIYQPTERNCRVIFIGTLVPLHGIDVLAEAARQLSARTDIEFHILGDGACASDLQSRIAHLSNVTWQRRWHTAQELAHEIRKADICLGIFGATAKAQRVCPYKIYSYACVGRAVITGDTEWLKSVKKENGKHPFLGVPVNEPTALAHAIQRLADAPEERRRLASAARSFYAAQLSNEFAMQTLMHIIHPH